MTKFALRGLLGRKLRTALTAIAIVLGVAMISGTYVLTDSIDQAFDTIFTDIRAGLERGHHRQVARRHRRPGGCVRADPRRVAAAPGARAFGRRRGGGKRRLRRDAAHRRRRQGDRLRGRSQPRLLHRERRLRIQPAHAASRVGGRRRTRSSSTRRLPGKEDFAVGETIGVQAEGPVEHLRMSGIVQFSSGLTIGGATLAGFDLPTAQRLFKKVGQFDEIAVVREARRHRTPRSCARSGRSCRRRRR